MIGMISRSAQTKFTARWPLARVGFLVGGVSALTVFALPLLVPVPMVQTVSASYVAGFNNRIAILSTAAMGALVLVWSWWQSRAPGKEVEEPELGRGLIASTIIATCLFTACAGWLVARSHLRYLADAGYFMEQLAAHADYGSALYTHLEFAYGPLLFYPAVWVHAVLRVTWPVSYFVALALNQTAGLLMLAYVLNALPIRARERRIVFVLLAIGAINPLLGINYTFFRFLTPLATLLFATRSPSLVRTTLLLAVGEGLQLGISPEMGFIFLFATSVFAGLAAWKRGARWLVVAAAPPLGLGLFLLVAGPSYLRMFQSVAHGALNLPVAPYPHILIFLFALVWLIPLSLGPMLRSFPGTAGPDGIRIVSCYVLSVALLPAAFGRCDPLHVFFNGAGILILSVVATSHLSPRLRHAWMVALLCFVVWVHWVNDRLYADRTADTLRLALTHGVHLDDLGYVLDVDGLEHEVGAAKVAIPYEVSLPVEEALKRSGHYRAEYYAFFVDVMDPVAEGAKVASMNQAEWALVPTDPDEPFLETPTNIDEVQGFAFPYPLRHPVPYHLGQLFFANLEANWTAVRPFGPYTLYRRNNAVVAQ